MLLQLNTVVATYIVSPILPKAVLLTGSSLVLSFRKVVTQVVKLILF